MELIKKAKGAYIFISTVMVALGLWLVIEPKRSALTVCYVVGGMITIFGVIKLISYFSDDLYRLAFQFDFALGIVSLVVGILMLIHPMNVVHTMPIIVGVFVLSDGAFKLQTAIDAKRFGMRYWQGIMLLAVLTCAGGLFLVIHPFEGATALMILLGVTLIVDGIQNLIIAACTVRSTGRNHFKDTKD